jgi:Flp pilus assembly protein TadG
MVVRQRVSDRLRNRDGVALVLTVFFLTVLMGAATLSIDLSSMYLFRTQLQRTADASALAGAIGLGKGEGTNAQTSITNQNHLNKVGDSTNTLVTMTAGTWDGTFHAGNWTDATANAVRVTVQYPGKYSFGRFFGKTTQMLHASAVAVHGSSPTSNCVRPWAVPYRDLLDHLPGGTTFPITHELTAAEVATLANATIADVIELNQSGTDGAPHQMRAVSFPPLEYASSPYQGNPDPPSANVYRSEISESCADLANRIGARGVSVGDYLNGASGQMTGPTEDGVNELLCGDKKGCPAGTPPKRVNVAIWDTFGASPHGFCAASGNNACYHIKYVGIFYVTGYNHSGNSVKGYFSAVGDPTASGFSTAVAPISKNALVQ